MTEYLKQHEAFIRAALDGERGDLPLEELRAWHDKQVAYMQHERLIHLLVTLFVATFTLLTLGWVQVHASLAGLVLALLFLGLTSAYLVHYFRLENGVQRWYHLANRIDAALGRVSASYAEGGERAPR